MLEIAEDSVGIQASEDFSVEFAFACMDQVMDCEAGDDRIECPKFGKRFAKVMFDNLDAWIGREAVMQTVEHRRGEVERDGFGVGAIGKNKGEQAAIAAAEVEDAIRGRWNKLQQGTLAFRAVWDRVRPGEIVECVFG